MSEFPPLLYDPETNEYDLSVLKRNQEDATKWDGTFIIKWTLDGKYVWYPVRYSLENWQTMIQELCKSEYVSVSLVSDDTPVPEDDENTTGIDFWFNDRFLPNRYRINLL